MITQWFICDFMMWASIKKWSTEHFRDNCDQWYICDSVTSWTSCVLVVIVLAGVRNDLLYLVAVSYFSHSPLVKRFCFIFCSYFSTTQIKCKYCISWILSSFHFSFAVFWIVRSNFTHTRFFRVSSGRLRSSKLY